MRQPNFDNLLKVLNRQCPDRDTLFEFFLNTPLYERLAGRSAVSSSELPQLTIDAFAAAGYDYATCWGYGFTFPKKEIDHACSISLNDGAVITSREEFENYPWPDVDSADYSPLATLNLPDGMKLIAHGPCGVLENLISLVGYDNLCMMLYDDPQLVSDIVDQIASRLLRHYEICCTFPKVGACIVNDDWGFASGPMISPEDMRNYIIPWTTRVVEAIHASGRPAIQHSCGNVFDCGLIEDVIDVCKFDGRHSYEDNTLCVEDAYERYGHRIAILGGIDLDFLCRKTPAEIKARARKLLDQTRERGSYALGSGNSIPEYVPQENYLAMISCV